MYKTDTTTRKLFVIPELLERKNLFYLYESTGSRGASLTCIILNDITLENDIQDLRKRQAEVKFQKRHNITELYCFRLFNYSDLNQSVQYMESSRLMSCSKERDIKERRV